MKKYNQIIINYIIQYMFHFSLLNALSLEHVPTNDMQRQMANWVFGSERCALCNVLKPIKQPFSDFCVFIFREIVDFILKILWKLGLRGFCEPALEMLTSDTR